MRQNANVCLGLSPIFTDAVNNAVLSEYAYQYDDIGNRLSSLDLGTNRTYTANALNQYAQIPNLCDSASLRGNITLSANPVLDGCRVQMAKNFWTFYTAKSV